jgi:hypothetical protein
MFPTNEMISQYRKVFSSNEGLEVMTHMLFDLGMFEEIAESNEDVALKNYANRLLLILSGSAPEKENMQEFIKRLMQQPLPKVKDES